MAVDFRHILDGTIPVTSAGIEVFVDPTNVDGGVKNTSSAAVYLMWDRELYDLDPSVSVQQGRIVLALNGVVWIPDTAQKFVAKTASGTATLQALGSAGSAENLGLGTVSSQDADAVDITGGTIDAVDITGGTVSALDDPIAIADGGTNAATAADARTSLNVPGLGTPTTPDATADNVMAASAADKTPLVVQGAPGQSAPLLELQASDGTQGPHFSVQRLTFGGPSGPADIYFENPAQALVFKGMQTVTGARKIGAAGYSNNSDLGFGGRYFLFTGSDGTDSDGGIERESAGVIAITDGQPGTYAALKSDDYRLVNEAEGGVACLTRGTYREVVALSGATSSTSLAIPSGVLLDAVQMNVDVEVSDDGGDNTWSAELNDGSTVQALAAGAAAAQNTKVNYLPATPILTDAETEIVFTPNGGSFDAGSIEVLVYYRALTPMDDAAA